MDEKEYLPIRFGPEQVLLENRFKKVYKVDVDFEGFSKEYFVDDCGERVALLVLRGDEVLLVRQFRLLINGLSTELPGGSADGAETFEEAAVRECLEETGICARNPKPLFEYHMSLEGVKNYTRLFITREFEVAGEMKHDPAEVVEFAWVPLDRCLEMIARREITDSMTIIGLLYYATLAK